MKKVWTKLRLSLPLLMAGLLLLSMAFGLPLGGRAAPVPNDPPVIGVDHPTVPGEAMLFKKAEAIDGLVNTWQVTLRVEAMDTVQTSDTIIVIDTSGSMGDDGKMVAARDAARTLINDLLPVPTPATPLNRVAVISFDYYADQVIGFTSSNANAIAAVNSLWAGGGTYTQDAVHDARILMGGSNADHKNIVLLSDGVPTYSTAINYNWRMNAANLTGRTPSGYWTPTTVPQNQFNYGTRVGGGSVFETRYDNPGGSDNDKYYHHGNSAIAEAGFTKAAGSTLYTIYLNTPSDPADAALGTAVLNNMASPGKAYTASPANLTAIFSEIAGEINSAVRNASVSDPMGTGFEVNGTVEDITVSQGVATYTDNRISWLIGTLTEPIATGSNIKYAEMTYQVTINDGILDAVGDDGKFNTNNGASLTYTYTDSVTGEDKTITVTFPEPSEDPVLLIMEKKLIDSLGRTVTTSQAGTDNRQFNLNVTNNFAYNNNYLLYAGQRRVMTNLRLEATYTVLETAASGTPASILASDYVTSYQIGGEAAGATSFYVGNDGLDRSIVVTNAEKPLGKLTVTKVFIPQAEGGTAATGAAVDGLSFPFTVSGPTGPNFPNNTHTFSLKPGESMVLENLPYGQYTVQETDSLGFLATYTDNDAPPASTTDGVVTLAINAKERTVTVTNRPTVTDELTSVTGYKQWNNGPLESHVAVEMNLFADGVQLDPQPAYTVSPESGNAGTFTYTWVNLPKYNQSAQPIAYTIEERGTIADYNTTYSADGLTVINTYDQGADIEVRATKVWSNGPLLKPGVWFRLYRTYTPLAGAQPVTEPVPAAEAPIRELAGGTVGSATPPVTSAVWSNLPARAPGGQVYAYSVQEVDASGNDMTPSGYTKSGGTGTATPTQITNRFTITKTSASAIKAWTGGDAAARPTVWFKLYRTYTNNAGQSITEEVPLTQAPIRALPQGTTTASWSNLDATDSFGNVYTFSVREVDQTGTDDTWKPLNYVKSGGQGTATPLTITNAYVPPRAEVPANKVWIGGPIVKPTVGFRLFRHTGAAPSADLELDAVTSASPKPLFPPNTAVTFGLQDQTDGGGQPYTYYIREVYGGLVNNVLQWSYTAPATFLYDVSYSGVAGANPPYGLTATNAYRSPLMTVDATKAWTNGDPGNRPAIVFQLWRRWSTMDEGGVITAHQEIASADTKAPAGSPLTASWPSMPETDGSGNKYTYYVVEGQMVGGVFTNVEDLATPFEYIPSGSGSSLHVNNIYSPPVSTVKATKVYANLPAGMAGPAVAFQLYRYSAEEAAHTVGSPVKLDGVAEALIEGSGEAPGWTYNWGGMPEKDLAENPYTYYVVEVAATVDGVLIPVPANFSQDTVNDLTVTNTWLTTTVTGIKEWDYLGSDIPPAGSFAELTLYQQLPGLDAVPYGAPVRLDGTEQPTQWQHVWNGLPQFSPGNQPYTYFVVETDWPVSYTSQLQVDSTTNTYTFTNTFQFVNIAAWKEYRNATAETVAFGPVGFNLIRDGVATPYKTGTVNGAVDSPPQGENGSGELVAWAYTWKGLPKYKDKGTATTSPAEHVYTVTEPIIPGGFVLTMEERNDGTPLFVNTYRGGTFSAKKEWLPEGVEPPAGATVTFELYQTVKDDATVPPQRNSMGTVTLNGVVDNTNPAYFADNNGEYAPWSYIWHNLPGNDPGNTAIVYEYEIVETNGPANYYYDTISGASTVATNYAELTGFTATKKWVNGPKPDVTFELWRTWEGNATPERARTESGTAGTELPAVVLTGSSTVTGSETGELAPTNANTWHYRWADLPRYQSISSSGTVPPTVVTVPYVYYVREILPDAYTQTPADGTITDTITNTYQIPSEGAFSAAKEWVNADNHTHPDIWFQLWRSYTYTPEGGTEPVTVEEAVPESEVGPPQQLIADIATWTGLKETTIEGYSYTFSVVEGLVVDGAFIPTLPSYYEVDIAPSPAGAATDLTVTNTYSATGSLTLTAVKRLAGRPLNAGDFSFTLAGVGTAPLLDATGTDYATAALTVANAAPAVAGGTTGSVTFPTLYFNESTIGTYTYILREVNGGETGMAYSGLVVEATVVVSDPGNGRLSVSATYKNQATDLALTQAELVFENAYAAAGLWAPVMTKNLTGRPLQGDDFTFTLTGNGQDQSVKNTQAGTVGFEPVPYTQADIGKTYTYTIREVNDGENGMAYSSLVLTAAVTITNAGNGELNAVVVYKDAAGAEVAPDDLVFENTYTGAGFWQPSAQKQLNGRVLKAGEFAFTLTGNGQNQTKTNALLGSVLFDKVNYTQDDIGQTYTYTIQETAGSETGMVYSGLVVTATVAITDAGKGALNVDVSYSDGTNPLQAVDLVFVNEYAATGSLNLQGTKEMDGRGLLADLDLYTFTVKEGATVVATGQNNGTGTITFTPITYTQDDLTRSPITLTVSEDASTVPGVTTTTLPVQLTVTLADAGNGTLSAVASYPDQAGGVSFVNPYDPELLDITVTKVWEGGPEADHEPVELDLYAQLEGGAPALLPDAVASIQPAQGPADSFTYTWVGLPAHDPYNKPFSYFVREAAAQDGQVVINDNLYALTLSGTQITNTYQPPESVQLQVSARKTLEGATLRADQFAFRLQGEGLDQTVRNDAQGLVTFPALSYTAPGAYTYTLREVDEARSRYTYDSSVYTLTVMVTLDAADNTLKPDLQVTVDGQAHSGDIVFDNTYTPAPAAVSVPIEVKKLVEGLTLKAGDFTFTLHDHPGNVLETVTNRADGTIRFEPLRIGTEGTHLFTIRETKGSDTGIVFDEGVIQVRVTAREAGGALEASVSYRKDGALVSEPSFLNKRYMPPTGDSFLQLPLILLAVSALLAAGYLVLRKRAAGKNAS